MRDSQSKDQRMNSLTVVQFLADTVWFSQPHPNWL